MAVSSPTPIARRARPAWLDALVVAAACWPWLGGLHFAPLAADSLKWMTASASTSPDWVRWVFGTQHFVGYRPVTGLSFTLTHLAFG